MRTRYINSLALLLCACITAHSIFAIYLLSDKKTTATLRARVGIHSTVAARTAIRHAHAANETKRNGKLRFAGIVRAITVRFRRNPLKPNGILLNDIGNFFFMHTVPQE